MEKIIYPGSCLIKNSICSSKISSFLIPENYVAYIQKKQKEFNGKLGNYLSYLLSRYGYLLANDLKNESNINTVYQDKDLNLRKISFTTSNEDWSLLKLIKLKTGFSICAIFTYLLILDSSGFGKNLSRFDFGVPKLRNFFLSVTVALNIRKKYWKVKYRQIARYPA